MTESSGEFLRRLGTDADVWAEEFCIQVAKTERVRLDPAPGELVQGWFCNAIQAGESAGYALAERNAAEHRQVFGRSELHLAVGEFFYEHPAAAEDPAFVNILAAYRAESPCKVPQDSWPSHDR